MQSRTTASSSDYYALAQSLEAIEQKKRRNPGSSSGSEDPSMYPIDASYNPPASLKHQDVGYDPALSSKASSSANQPYSGGRGQYGPGGSGANAPCQGVHDGIFEPPKPRLGEHPLQDLVDASRWSNLWHGSTLQQLSSRVEMSVADRERIYTLLDHLGADPAGKDLQKGIEHIFRRRPVELPDRLRKAHSRAIGSASNSSGGLGSVSAETGGSSRDGQQADPYRGDGVALEEMLEAFDAAARDRLAAASAQGLGQGQEGGSVGSQRAQETSGSAPPLSRPTYIDDDGSRRLQEAIAYLASQHEADRNAGAGGSNERDDQDRQYWKEEEDLSPRSRRTVNRKFTASPRPDYGHLPSQQWHRHGTGDVNVDVDGDGDERGVHTDPVRSSIDELEQRIREMRSFAELAVKAGTGDIPIAHDDASSSSTPSSSSSSSSRQHVSLPGSPLPGASSSSSRGTERQSYTALSRTLSSMNSAVSHSSWLQEASQRMHTIQNLLGKVKEITAYQSAINAHATPRLSTSSIPMPGRPSTSSSTSSVSLVTSPTAPVPPIHGLAALTSSHPSSSISASNAPQAGRQSVPYPHSLSSSSISPSPVPSDPSHRPSDPNIKIAFRAELEGLQASIQRADELSSAYAAAEASSHPPFSTSTSSSFSSSSTSSSRNRASLSPPVAQTIILPTASTAEDEEMNLLAALQQQQQQQEGQLSQGYGPGNRRSFVQRVFQSELSGYMNRDGAPSSSASFNLNPNANSEAGGRSWQAPGTRLSISSGPGLPPASHISSSSSGVPATSAITDDEEDEVAAAADTLSGSYKDLSKRRGRLSMALPAYSAARAATSGAFTAGASSPDRAFSQPHSSASLRTPSSSNRRRPRASPPFNSLDRGIYRSAEALVRFTRASARSSHEARSERIALEDAAALRESTRQRRMEAVHNAARTVQELATETDVHVPRWVMSELWRRGDIKAGAERREEEIARQRLEMERSRARAARQRVFKRLKARHQGELASRGLSLGAVPGQGGATFSTTKTLAKERKSEAVNRAFARSRQRMLTWQEQRRSLMLDHAMRGDDAVFQRLSNLRDSDVPAARARTLMKEHVLTRAHDDKHVDPAMTHTITETPLFRHLYGQSELERRGATVTTSTSTSTSGSAAADPWAGLSIALPAKPQTGRSASTSARACGPASGAPHVSLTLSGDSVARMRWKDTSSMFGREPVTSMSTSSAGSSKASGARPATASARLTSSSSSSSSKISGASSGGRNTRLGRIEAAVEAVLRGSALGKR